jgi:hypothetical protein
MPLFTPVDTSVQTPSAPCIGDHLLQNIGQPRISRPIIELDVLFDQFVSKFRVPSLHRDPGCRVRGGGVWSHDQKRVGFLVAVEESVFEQEFTLGPQCGGQWIADPERLAEILAPQRHAFRLQHDAIG